MPTYRFICKSCSYEFEDLQFISEAPLTTCPSCGKETVSRMIGGGSGLVFKGSGFYLTDYKKSGGEPVASVPKTETKKETETKTETAAAPASEPKPAAKPEPVAAKKDG